MKIKKLLPFLFISVTIRNSDLDNNLARAALSYNLLAQCDRPTFLQWNSETLNTPYKAGLTSGSYGFAFVYGSYTTQMVLFAMALGTYEIFVCTVNNGQSSTWKKINPDFYMKINPEPTTEPCGGHLPRCKRKSFFL